MAVWSKAQAIDILRKRKARAEVDAYESLIETPHDLSTSLVLPHNAKLYAGIATPPAGAKIQFFSFTFDALDASRWDQFITNGVISVVDGALDLITDAVAGSSVYYNIDNAYDLSGSEAFVRLVRPLQGTVNADGARTVFRIFDTADGGDCIEWFVATNGDLVARVSDGGTPTDNTVVADWNEAEHAWLKLSLDGTTVTFWTAPDKDGRPGAWTARHTNASLPSTFTSAKITLFAEYWGADPGAITQSARFDSLNVGAPVLLCTVNGVDRYILSAAPDEIVPLGYFEKGATVTAVYNASTINLYLGAPLGERPLIATKTV